MKFVLTVIVMAALSGCQTIPQQQARPTDNDDPSEACYRQAFSNPALTVLNKKVGNVLSIKETTIAQLADVSKASDDEKEALSLWGTERKRCVDLGRQFRGQYAPADFSSALESAQSNLIILTSQVYSGEITWGQFNVARERNAQLTAEKLNAARTQERSTIRNQLAQDEQRSNAALQMMMEQQKLQQQQQKILQQNMLRRPTQTDCTRIGNNVSCTTN